MATIDPSCGQSNPLCRGYIVIEALRAVEDFTAGGALFGKPIEHVAEIAGIRFVRADRFRGKHRVEGDCQLLVG